MAKVGLQFVVTVELDDVDNPDTWEPDSDKIAKIESEINGAAYDASKKHLIGSGVSVYSARTTFEDVTQ